MVQLVTLVVMEIGSICSDGRQKEKTSTKEVEYDMSLTSFLFFYFEFKKTVV